MQTHSLLWTRAHPEDVDAWYILGIAYEGSGETVKAITAYQQAMRINPEHAHAWYCLGIAYGKSGETSGEIECYQQALRVDPNYGEAWINIGVAYAKSRQVPEAIESFQQAILASIQEMAWLGTTWGSFTRRLARPFRCCTP